jgi:hypothetical protein
MVDVYSYIASDLVPEVLHEHIQHVTVLLDCSIHFRDKVLSESLPCDHGEASDNAKRSSLL